ncbi:CaiB/BaiF CoA-transferase family protein [Sphingobium sp.]|uniref:CaiB/BaiF CoA transferase family protein n=1 Tax=Sphingobium sp. TaxID=1912891 RepID=UPI0028BED388|nr:CaiB/BaiF CoA-transferase family protein [Sphingobium sp.]
MSGPLAGIRVVEFAGLGPTPFAAMMLADMGADVIRLDRPGGPLMSAGDGRLAFLNRSRASVAVDLKSEQGRDFARGLIERADIVIEGFRPGVMERLGLGPEVVAGPDTRLIYGRMTGWGQQGPLADKAGHDINYIAMTGALHMVGPADRPPPPPLNLFGDYGGGALFLVTGILAALVERGRSGRGQVVDAAMVDGAASLLTELFAWRAMGFWTDERGANLLDGGAYFYRCYATSDGRYMAIGAIEPQFHAAFITGLGLDPADFPDHMDRRQWHDRALRIEAVFRTRTRAEWVETFEPHDACVTPVLTPAEAAEHPANTDRRVFTAGDAPQPVPAPRLSRTGSRIASPPGLPGEGGRAALIRFGVPTAAFEPLIGQGILRAE